MNQILDKVLLIAVLVEILTNFIKTVIPDLQKRFIPIAAGIIGIAISAVTEVGVLNTLDISVNFPFIDYLITGIIVSRGSNIVHDLAKKLNF